MFLDLGTPKAVDVVASRDDEAAVIIDTETPEEVALLTDVYADLKLKLTARGINDGLARIIVGSTAKLGTGVNVQKRLAALHHLDAPWRPMDLEHFVASDACLTGASVGRLRLPGSIPFQRQAEDLVRPICSP